MSLITLSLTKPWTYCLTNTVGNTHQQKSHFVTRGRAGAFKMPTIYFCVPVTFWCVHLTQGRALSSCPKAEGSGQRSSVPSQMPGSPAAPPSALLSSTDTSSSAYTLAHQQRYLQRVALHTGYLAKHTGFPVFWWQLVPLLISGICGSLGKTILVSNS